MSQLLIFIVVDINEKQVKGETIMINVACYTLKEVDDILKIAEAVGFECANHTKPTSFIGSKIYEDGAIVSLEFNPQQIVRIYSVEKGKRIDVSANELLMLVSGNSDEMTAKEFIHKYKRMNNCEDVPECSCNNCIWSRKHTKCGKDLCEYFDYETKMDDEFEKELLEIVETYDNPVWTDPEKKIAKKDKEEAIGILEETIKGLKDSEVNNKLTEALEVALNSLRTEDE